MALSIVKIQMGLVGFMVLNDQEPEWWHMCDSLPEAQTMVKEMEAEGA